MAHIHLFGGEKGDGGKSFVCRTAVAYHLDKGIDCVPFDTDRSNADVWRIYRETAGCRQAILSEADKFDDAANAIFNMALDGRRVLVNLPAQSMPSRVLWIENNELFEQAKDCAQFDAIGRQRVRAFLRKSFKEFDRVGVFDGGQ